jgi:DNA-binding MarR family transcriptional regulator
MAEHSTGILERRLKQHRPVTDLVRRALINLQVAFAHFEEDFDAVTAEQGLSNSSYNVLRILRGHPEGHPRNAIAERLVYRGTDVTRIVDRLARRGLVERVRSTSDRRLSLARITAKGVKAVNALDGSVETLVDSYRKKLSLREYGELNRLLEALYADKVD